MTTFYVSPCSSETAHTKAGSQTINLQTRRECDDVMERIYGENRSFWPYGLSRLGHDDLYLVREASTGKPVGFTGWQERKEGSLKVGYYSIGILPEYRRNGFAKKAVAALIQKKSAGVDRVQAFVMPHNAPSHALAAALGIPVVHEAGGAVVKQAYTFHPPTMRSSLWGLGLGAGAAGFWDLLQHPDAKYPFDPNGGENDRWRVGNAILNGSIVGAPAAARSPIAAMTGFALSPAKDLMVRAFPAVDKLPNTLQAVQDAATNQPNNGKALAILAGIGGLGLVGGGILGHKLLKTLRDQSSRGHVRVKLPTRDPRDQETTVEMPIQDARIPMNLYESLGRDTRRKLREESKERTWRRGEKHQLLTHDEEGGGDINLDEPEDSVAEPKRRKRASLEQLAHLVNLVCPEE